MAGTPISAALTLRSGEPFVLRIALTDASGAPQLLTGRAFSLVITKVGATDRLVDVDATLSDDVLYAVASLTGDQTSTLYNTAIWSRVAAYAIIETIDAGQVTIGAGSLTAQPSPASPSSDQPTTIDLPYSQAIVRPDALVVNQTGGRGLSAAEQFAIGGIDPTDPTTAAMFTALQAPALEAAGVADTAATNADEKAQAAQAVVDAQAASLATVAAAVTQTGQDRTQTGADRQQTGQDRGQTGADRGQTGADVVTAGAAVVTAQGYRDAAGASASNASNASGQAGISAALAQAGVPIYPDAATGLAAVTEGSYFFVIGTGNAYATVHRKVSGADSGILRTAIDKTALDAMLASFSNLNFTSNDGDPLIQIVNAMGFYLGVTLQSGGGFELPGLRFNMSGDTGPLSIANKLGFELIGWDALDRLCLPGLKIAATGTGGMQLLDPYGNAILSREPGAPLIAGDMTIGSIAWTTSANTLLMIVNGLGFVLFEIALDGSVKFAGTSSGGGVTPTVIDVTPIMGTEIFLASDRKLPFFGRNVLTTRTDNNAAVYSIDSRPGLPVQPFARSETWSPIDIDPARMGTTATLTVRDLTQRDTRLVKTLNTFVQAVPVTGSPAPKIMLIGDSLTVRDTITSSLALLQYWGFAPVYLGTMPISGTSGPFSEAREGRALADFCGTSTLDNVVAAGSEAAYLAMTRSTRITYNPFLRLATGGDSPSLQVTIGGSAYVFDFAFYLSRFGIAAPDVITLNLATNDYLLFSASQALANVNLLLPRMLDSIRAACPNAKIVVWETVRPVSTTGDAGWLSPWSAILKAVVSIVATRQLTDTKLHLVSAWAHESAEAGWQTATGTTDATTGVTTTTIADSTHPYTSARDQHIEALTNALAYLAKH